MAANNFDGNANANGHFEAKNKDLRLVTESSSSSPRGDGTPQSTGSPSQEMTPGFGPLSPTSADAGRNVAVDYMKSRYQKDKKDPRMPALPSVVREPKKLDFQWDKIVDEKLKKTDVGVPGFREQDLMAMMLTCGVLDSGKSQYFSIVENSAKEPEIPINREPVEKVAPPEITKKVRDMFETGKLTDLHDPKKRQDSYDILPGSGVFENEPVQLEGVVRSGELSTSEGEEIQRGLTKNLLDQWQNKTTTDVVRDDDGNLEGVHILKGTTKSLLGQWQTIGSGGGGSKPQRRSIIIVADAEGNVSESTPIRREDVVRGDDVVKEGEAVQKGTTKSLLNQWSTKGTEENRIETKRINVADGEGKVLESQPIRRTDVVREDDADVEGEQVQRGMTKSLLTQWKSKDKELFQTDKRPINIAEDEGRVAENDPVKRQDVARGDDLIAEGERIQRGTTRSLLGQWKDIGSKEFQPKRRSIILAEAEGMIAENEPVRRDDVVHASDADEGDVVKQGITKSLLVQWKTKGTEEFAAAKGPINVACAEGKVAENEPIRREDVAREVDAPVEGEQIQTGTTRSLLNQWQNKREEFKKDKTPIVVAEADGVVAENEPARRDDAVRENDVDSEAERIQRGTTKALLSQWQNKKDEFRKEKTPIVITEGEGTVAENEPVVRQNVVREDDVLIEGEVVQKGTTKSLLNQWKFKGSQEFIPEKRTINIAEDEGKVAENEPVQRSDVVRAYDYCAEEEQVVERGLTKSRMEQWRNKSSQEFKIARRSIVIAEDDGTVAENEPANRSDVVREYDGINVDEETVQKGITKNLLGQWKNKGSEQFQAPKKEIVLAEDEGKIIENEPIQRSDVVREYDYNFEAEKVQKGMTKNLLGQWMNKGSEQFQAPKKEIILAEDEGKVVESKPVERTDVAREYNDNSEGEMVQKGITKNLLGQWKHKGSEQFQAPKREIVLDEAEGKFLENEPVQRTDVVREYNDCSEGETIQKGLTRNLLGQWKNKSSEQFQALKKEIVIAEDEGKIVENEPVPRTDVAREYNDFSEGEKIQKGLTQNLLGQWQHKGSEQYHAPKREIVLAEDEGKVVENEPVQRSDLVRENDYSSEGEKIQKGMTKSLLGQWKNKGSEQFQAPKKEIVIAEDEGKIVENEPVQRTDLAREYDCNSEIEKIQRGMTKNLLGQWIDKGSKEFQTVKREIVLAEDEGKILENHPVQRSDVARENDNDVVKDLPRKGQARDLTAQWISVKDTVPKEHKEVILFENENEPSVIENDPVRRTDVVREEDNFEEIILARGLTKNLAGYFQNGQKDVLPKKPFRLEMDVNPNEVSVYENEPVPTSGVVNWMDPVEEVMGKRGLIQTLSKQYMENNSSSPRTPMNAVDGKPAWIREMEEAPGSGVFENEPMVRMGVTREAEYEPDTIPVTQTRNTRRLWSMREHMEEAPKDEIPQLVRFTPPRELTPPPIHQEDHKSYRIVTLSSEANSSSGPMSPPPQSTSSFVEPTIQNHSGENATQTGVHLLPKQSNDAYHHHPQPSTEITIKSSALLALKPS